VAFNLPPTITASTWASVWEAIWLRLQKRGTVRDSHGSVTPRMTNREAIALIEVMRRLAPVAEVTFTLWYQYAAQAYGWDPWADRNVLFTTKAQADKEYPADLGVQLMLMMQRLAGALDDSRKLDPPSVHPDEKAFDDRVFQGDVAEALKRDEGTDVKVVPVPTGKCRQKDGTERTPRIRCDKKDPDGFARRKRKVPDPTQPGGIREIDCDQPGDCEAIIIDVGGAIIPPWVWWAAALGAAIYVFAPGALGGAIAGRIANKRRRRGRN